MHDAVGVDQGGADGLDRLAGEALTKVFAPGRVEAAVGRPQRCQRDARLFEEREPLAVRTEPRPAAATEGQYDGLHLLLLFALRGGER
jgi:hypothetical protein